MNKHLYIKFILSDNVDEDLFLTNLRSWLANANDQLGSNAIVFYMPVEKRDTNETIIRDRAQS